MKLLTFDARAGQRLGAMTAGGVIVDLSASGQDALASMQSLLRQEETAWIWLVPNSRPRPWCIGRTR